MKSIWERTKFEHLTEKEKKLGHGMVEMFMQLGPFKTFGTISVAPKHDRCKVAAAAMEKIVLRTFRKRRFGKMKFGYFIESNKNRPGTHAHFVTKDEPSDLRWAGAGSVGEYMIERYGRFQTAKVNGEKTFGLAAYLAKYCSKELSDQHWGFHGWIDEVKEKAPKLRAMWDVDPAPPMSRETKKSLRRDAMEWKRMKWAGRLIRQHASSRENGRTNVRTFEVREDPKVPGEFKQELVYNNLK